MIQGRLLVTPETSGEEADYRRGCALSMSGVLDKPASDGPVEVEVETQSAEGASKATMVFAASPGFLRSQRLTLELEGAPEPCRRALALRGNVGGRLAFVKQDAVERGVVGYRTLAADHRFEGRAKPYAWTSPERGAHADAVPAVDLFAGEPVALLAREADGFRVAVDRIYLRGGIGRAVEAAWIPAEKLAEQPRDVEAMSALAPR